MLASASRASASSQLAHVRRRSDCSSAQRPCCSHPTPLILHADLLQPFGCRHLRLGKQQPVSQCRQLASHKRESFAGVESPLVSKGRRPARGRGHRTCAAAESPDLPAGGDALPVREGFISGDQVAAEFQRVVNERGMEVEATPRCPTHLMPPTTVVAAQLNALQRNDWPDTDAGARTAFEFSKPHDAENLLPGQVAGESKRAHAWAGTELWLPFKDFSNMLHSPPYSVILNCDSWQLSSPLLFPSQRSGERALQAVEVVSARRGGEDEGLRPYTFTFCLERVEAGPFKIRQAGESLTAQLPKAGKAKGFKAASVKRFAIEVPLADDGAEAKVQLVKELLAELPDGVGATFTVVCADLDTAGLASERLRNPVSVIDPAESGVTKGPLLIVNPRSDQLADVQEMLFDWRGGLAVTLNAGWDPEQTEGDLSAFLRAFEPIYCFQPLAIQGFITTTEGVVFKWVKKGSPAAVPWVICRKEGDEFKQIGRQQRRPSAGELELAFYNASAAKSPLTQGVKSLTQGVNFVKGLTGRAKK